MLRKCVHANEALFMTKELHEAIMKRFELRNKFLKSRKSIKESIHITTAIKKMLKEHLMIKHFGK